MFLDYHMSSAPLSINSLGEHNAEDGSERNESSGSHRNLDRALELEVANVVAGEEGREVVLIGGRRRGRLEEEEVAALRGTRRGEGPGRIKSWRSRCDTRGERTVTKGETGRECRWRSGGDEQWCHGGVSASDGPGMGYSVRVEERHVLPPTTGEREKRA